MYWLSGRYKRHVYILAIFFVVAGAVLAILWRQQDTA